MAEGVKRLVQVARIADVVVYCHPGSADGKFSPNAVSPAIVQRQNADRTLELAVLSVYGGIFFNHSVAHGPGAGTWLWRHEHFAETGGDPFPQFFEDTI